MLGMREAKYCNLKLFLIYLVVYGHLIEPRIENSAIFAAQYRFIYAFHMPLFAFLTGLFLKKRESCAKQAIRLLKIYLPLQLLAVLLGEASLWTPYWHLWYLLSAATWAAMAYILRRGRWIILLISVVLGCAVGYIPVANRAFSLSRTLVFFSYFWAGFLCKSQTPWHKYRGIALLALLAALLLLHLPISARFFYQADAYARPASDVLHRLASYGIGAGFCFFLLAFAPRRRFFFTKAGADTLPTYLLHAPFVLLLRKGAYAGWLCPILCALLLSLIYKSQQCRRNLYGITQPWERRCRWQLFRKSTKHTHARSTDSSTA